MDEKKAPAADAPATESTPIAEEIAACRTIESLNAVGSPVVERGVVPLVACPLCGGGKGYSLRDGATYRWWNVQCNDCGRIVDECSSDRRTQLGTELPGRWPAADAAWNAAGAHAESLRECIREMAQANAWQNFGECRGWTLDAPKQPHEVDALAREALRHNVLVSRQGGAYGA